jgi:hypothetical protein
MILDEDKSTGKNLFALGDTIKIRIREVLGDRYLWTAEYKGMALEGHNFLID